MNDLILNEVEMPIKPKGFKKMSAVFGNGRNTNSRNSRDIHKYMGVKTKYSMWIKRRIHSLGAEENVDFVVPKNGNGKSIDFEEVDYIVTDDFAKHLGMVERNPKGKQVRDYFIYMEKLARYLIVKKVEECSIKAELQNKTIKQLQVKKYKTYKNGNMSLSKYLKDRNIPMTLETAFEKLALEKIIESRDVVVSKKFLANEVFGIQNGDAVIEFNPRALDTVFDEYIILEPNLFGY